MVNRQDTNHRGSSNTGMHHSWLIERIEHKERIQPVLSQSFDRAFCLDFLSVSLYIYHYLHDMTKYTYLVKNNEPVRKGEHRACQITVKRSLCEARSVRGEG